MPLPKFFSVVAVSLMGMASVIHAEDPLLGVVRALKCVNCVPDSVVFLVDDPIDGQQIEVKIPSREFNKILTSLQGKRLFTKPDSGCFYWQEKLKAPKSTTESTPGSTKEVPKGSAKTSGKGSGKDSLQTSGAQAGATDGNLYKSSACIPFSAEFKGVN
jgi:hypothetical protein